MELINLLPVAVKFPNGKRIEPSGSIVELQEKLIRAPHPLDELDISIFAKPDINVRINGLPFPSESIGVYYIVSAASAAALRFRPDLLIPVGGVEEDSRELLCPGLAIANPIVTRGYESGKYEGKLPSLEGLGRAINEA